MSASWDQYNTWNRRDRKMSRVWVEKLCRYIQDNDLAHPKRACLDFGCGYFDVGFLLAASFFQFDGYDPFAPSLDAVNDEVGALPGSQLFQDRKEIPKAGYDLIIVNSVFQYLTHHEELAETLVFLKTRLKPSRESCILISDLIPQNYPAPLDAVESVLYAFWNGVGLPMTSNVFKAALVRKNQPLLRVDPSEIEVLAGKAGFSSRILDENCTPSKRRYSCILHPLLKDS